MPGPGSLGNIANATGSPGWIGRKFHEMQRQIDNLRNANVLSYATIPYGGITVTNNGAVTVKDSDGRVVAVIGGLPAEFNRADGSKQPGIALYREDGTIAAVLGDVSATISPFKQAWQVFDRAGNVVLADDTNSGKGLANPYVDGGVILGDTNTARWPQTTSASFLSVMFGWYCIQNPMVQWDIQYVADTATAGQVKLLINGTQVDTTQTVGPSFGLWTRYNVSIPGSWAVGDIVSIDVQARRTSGSGNVYVQALRFSGDQSP